MDNETLDLYRAARQTIARLLERVAADCKYIEELEKQLEHIAPGLVKEAREYLGRE